MAKKVKSVLNTKPTKKILKEVIRQYPDTTASKLADERLRKIR